MNLLKLCTHLTQVLNDQGGLEECMISPTNIPPTLEKQNGRRPATAISFHGLWSVCISVHLSLLLSVPPFVLFIPHILTS